jgi:hypothetical protein
MVAASRDFFQVPVNNGFLASYSPASYSPAYRSHADLVPVAQTYTEYQIQGQSSASNDFVTTTCAVAMFAVIGYSIGRSTSQPREIQPKRKQLYRAKPLHLRSGAVVMEEEAAEEAAEAAPAAKPPAPDPTASYVRGDITNMVGTYQWKDGDGNKIFDPLKFSEKYDVNWLREAELKHGRVTMLALVGFLANDLGLKFPSERFQGISSVDAHDAMVQTGDMWTLLFVVGACEAVHMSKVVPKIDGDWEDWQPGNYGLDPWGWASDNTREAELKHSRLAMIAFGGLVTQSALGYPVTSYFQ